MKAVDQKIALTQLRSKLVGEMHVQPFTIYNDNVIAELVKAQPKTIAMLSKVKGFPENGKRIKGFGEAIIAIFNAKENETIAIDVKSEKGKIVVSHALKEMKVF